ncbi:MAG: 4Fe-4S binding protein [Candidatus Hodarchaeota archaeon]
MGKHLYANPMTCTGCTICALTCSLVNEGVINPNKAMLRIERKRDGQDILISCRHCERPRCMEACDEGAIIKEDRIVKIIEERCNSCLKCVDICPFGMIIWHPDFTTPKKCTLCQRCIPFCPVKVLEVRE